MSRVGKAPIALPKGVEVKFENGVLTVKGALSTLTLPIHSQVKVNVSAEAITFEPADESREAGAFQGTMRALVANMVKGVSAGFERKLNLVGVGYRVSAGGKDADGKDTIKLQLGFSHDVIYSLPAGIKAETPSQTELLIKGSDKQTVGQVAAEIRGFRPPEPYKGKGVRYSDEKVILKETKKK